MEWDIVPEIISALVIFIILFNSRDVNMMPSPRDKMFRFTLYYTIFCTALNILSIVTVRYSHQIPIWVNTVTNTAYFALYPPLPVVFIFYILLYVFELTPIEHRPWLDIYTIILLGSLAGYLVIVVLNIWTGWLFYFDETATYTRGPLNQLSLVVAIFQISVAIIAIIHERNYLNRAFFIVVVWLFPLSFIIIVLQILFPSIILTGTAIMIAILSVYLNFQTRRISIDNLTQYPNRESFISHLNHLKRNNRKSVVLIVSIDDFKLINDTYGQTRGDALLKVMAQGLQDILPQGQVYRYGGDEFAIILDAKHGQNLTETVLKRLEASWYVDGISIYVRAALALLDLPFKPDLDADPLTLLDHAIQTAKNQGRNQFVHCDSLLLKTIRRKNQLAERLMQAISQEALTLEFQPVYDLKSGTMEKAEALLRWNDPQLGSVSPSEFIPLAEEIGIIGELGRWVLEQVCTMLDQFRSEGIALPSISVNFSGIQFAETHIAREILDTIERYHIPPNTISIELTESTFIGASFKEALAVMNPLIEQGIHFHLDDFGTGYSNLSYMVNLPFKCIKLDKTLLWDVRQRNRMHQLVRSIIGAVRDMGLRVIVEGVETAEQVAYLKSIDCDLVQGYYFSPPIDKTLLAQALRSDT